MCFALFSPFFKALKRGVPCSEMAVCDRETHPELSMSHQLSANTGLNICQKLCLWVTVLQTYRILYSTSWQTHLLVLHLVKDPHMFW